MNGVEQQSKMYSTENDRVISRFQLSIACSRAPKWLASWTFALVAILFSNTGFADSVTYPDFSNVTGLTLNGDSVQQTTSDGTVLRLARATTSTGGTAFSTDTVYALSFSTYFQFRITSPGGGTDCEGPTGADGLTFIVQSVASGLGGGGGGLGYYGIPNSIAVEFDTYCNSNYNETSSNHMAIDVNGEVNHSLTGIPAVSVEPDFDDGNLWHVWVDYDGTYLQVRANQSGVRPEFPDLSEELDLAAILGQDYAYIGFGAGTGGAWGNHDIVYWEFRDSYTPIGVPVFVQSTNISSVVTSINDVRVSFSPAQPMAALRTIDFKLTTPYGPVHPVSASVDPNSSPYSTTYLLTFDPGHLNEVTFPDGEYLLEVGPYIAGSSPNDQPVAMDQNQNGTAAEVPGDVYSQSFSLDNAAPATPTVATWSSSPTQNVVNSNSIMLIGGREDETSLWLDGVQVVAAGNGNWEHTISLQEGVSSVSITARDLVGNESVALTLDFLVDTIAPVAGGTNPPAGVFRQDAGAYVYLEVNEQGSGVSFAASVLSATLDGLEIPGEWQLFGSQHFEFHPSSEIGEGTVRITAELHDVAGNVGNTLVSEFTIDRTAPLAPVLNQIPADTNYVTLTVSGTKEAYAAILLNGQELVGNTAATNWSAEVTLDTGNNTLTFTARDRANNISEAVVATIIYDDTTPGPVTVTGNGTGDGTTVDLSWQGYDEVANGGDIAEYIVYQGTATYTDTSQATAIASLPGGTQTHTVTGLTRDTTYHYAVVAKDTTGNVLTTVTPIAVLTVDNIAPPDVTGLTVDSFSDHLNVHWQAPTQGADDLTGYRVYRDGDTGTDVPAGTLNLDITSLTPATGYALRVTTVDGSGNESTGVTIDAATLLPNPTISSITPFDSKVELTWPAVTPSQYVKEYAIYVGEAAFTDVSGMTPRLRVNASKTTTQLAGLTNEVEYHFAVTAININDGETKTVTSVPATPTADETGPEITAITFNGNQLNDGAVVTENGVIGVVATDPAGISRVEFALDGTGFATDLNPTDGLSANWDIKATTDGAHVLAVTVYDSLENLTTQSISLTVDLAAPEAPAITTPVDGHVTNTETITVKGTAETGTTVSILRDAAVIAGPVDTTSQGTFSVNVSLIEGDNLLTAVANHRGGDSAPSSPVTVKRDTSVPDAPAGLAALSKSDGVIALTWNTGSDERVVGYRVYRATEAFTAAGAAVVANTNEITGGRFDDMPSADGTYFYRVVALNDLDTESELSNQADAVADSERPYATQITYTPSGAFDAQSGRMAPGNVAVALTVNEPLLTTPFLSLNTDGGTPISVPLTAANDTEYTGSFEITDATVSGIAYAVFSARDKVGNRGDVIEQGASTQFDTDGPAIVSLSVSPSEPIQNDQTDPVTIEVAFEIDQPVKSGTTPALNYLLSGDGRSLTSINGLSASDSTHWTASFTLPADAALSYVETIQFTFGAEDDLGNVGDEIKTPSRFQVYQGALPPLDIPTGLTAEALPGGEVRLSWQEVEGAAAYELYRQAPGESGLGVLQRVTTLTHIDATTVDGEYLYAVASVREANGQEAVSDLSESVSVFADSAAPGQPVNLTAELISAGVRLIWEAPVDLGVDEHVTYSVYRAAGTNLTDVSGLTPLQTSIVPNEEDVLGFVDNQPDKDQSVYVVTAVDDAGNESVPSNSAYLNIDLVPVANLAVRLEEGAYPHLSWQHNGTNINGYNVYLAENPTTPLNASLLATGQYDDFGYTGGVRDYLVTAVDNNGVESIARDISLVPVAANWATTNPVKRGVFNQVEVELVNPSARALDGVTVKVTLDAVVYQSEAISLGAGETQLVPLVIGGTDALPDIADYELEVQIVAETGELTRLLQSGQTLVGQDTLVMTVEAQTLTRGTEGQVRFVLENTSDVETEVVTAKAGSADSDVRLFLTDVDGNILATAPLDQSTGASVVALTDGRSVARIPAGATFNSAWAPLSIPDAAPDDIRIRIAVGQLHYSLGTDQAATIEGIDAELDASLVDTAYVATLDSVTPSTSFGDEPIILSGQALSRDNSTPLPMMPVKLVISGNGFERVKQLVTNSTGTYEYAHTPLPGESGLFTVSAIHPDLVTRPGQGSFTVGRIVVSPTTLNITVPKNYTHNIGTIRVSTGSASSATNARLVFEAADQPGGVMPAGVTLETGAPITLGENKSASLPFSLTANNSAANNGTLVLKVYTDETGAEPLSTVNVNYEFANAQPSLWPNVSFVETGVAHDQTVTEGVGFENRGLAELLDMQVTLLTAENAPAPDWLYLISPANQGNLAVGETKQVQFTAAPTAAVADGIYPFKLRATSSNHPEIDVNIYISVTQSGVGSVQFKASDIFTATLGADNQPIQGLANARIRIQHEQLVHEDTQVTDAFGEYVFEDIPAGRYRYRASASNHADVSGSFTIKPGVLGTVDVFLDYNLITVEWSVTEITLEDKYEITLQAIFETDVPAAVVVLEPTSTQLPDDMQPGDVFNGELRLTNYGLIRADNLTFQVPTDDTYFRYEIIGGLPDSLDAKASILIPYRVTALAPFQPDGSASGGGCAGYSKTMVSTYRYECTNGTESGGSTTHTWTLYIPASSCSNPATAGGPGPIGNYGGGTSYPGVYNSGTSSYDSLGGAQCVPTPKCPFEDGRCNFPSGFGGGSQ